MIYDEANISSTAQDIVLFYCVDMALYTLPHFVLYYVLNNIKKKLKSSNMELEPMTLR